MKSQGLTTKLLHSDRLGKPEHGSLHKPIHTSIAYGYEKAADLAAVFQSRQKGYAYARQSNPTVSALEAKVTVLEQGVGTVCFGTGMAALAAVFLAFLRKGDHVVSSRFLFGNTVNQINTLVQTGVEVSYVDATDAREVEAALRPETRLVLVETIANPATQIADLAGIGALCNARGLLYVVDNTLTSGCLFLPKDVGATFSVNSLSKCFGGHGDALGGSVTDLGLFDWSKYPNLYDLYKGPDKSQWALLQLRKKGLRDFGGTLAPEAAHVLSVGSETLPLRIERSCDNAQKLAEALAKHPKVAKVHYPGLPDHPQYARTKALFTRPGALLSFELKNAGDTFPVLDRLKVGILSSNLGDARTLLIPVAQTIFWELGEAKRAEMGIAESLVRVSVGIEDAEDLLADFQQALDG
ncbi:MAG: cystathionine gamma-synthase family protein [Fibrobacteria bacterium]|jgi:O-acetylhomoserine (thiol)-lyase|nr:cystathionine gamma-synthase family protein [Fibrobacteria bacterium]